METIRDIGPGRSRHGRSLTISAILIALAAGGIWIYRRAPGSEGHAGEHASATYYCPMHPTYKSDKPGNCPICSMKLVPLTTGSPSAPGQSAPETTTTTDPGADSSPAAASESVRRI